MTSLSMASCGEFTRKALRIEDEFRWIFLSAIFLSSCFPHFLMFHADECLATRKLRGRLAIDQPEGVADQPSRGLTHVALRGQRAAQRLGLARAADQH